MNNFFPILIAPMLEYIRTPIQEITNHPDLEQAGVRLLVKREDLNHPEISGNKWWKLKYNLLEARKGHHSTLLTFGGAFSNHIYSTAAAAAALRMGSVGVIRGEEVQPLNPTLQFAKEQGMLIQYVSRSAYREKENGNFISKLREKFGDFYLIPEGGTNLAAVKGCAEFAKDHLSKLDFDHLFLPVGTGGTMAGVICGFGMARTGKNVIGVSVLKGGAFLSSVIEDLILGFSGERFQNWSLLLGDHHGGYAKAGAELLSFMQEMRSVYHLPLDHVYTGKLFWSIIKQVKQGAFKRGETILALHTGGLQGTLQE